MTARKDSLNVSTDVTEDRHGRLEALAREIDRARHEAAGHGRANLDKQRVVGRALHESKGLLKTAKHPGGWRAWCVSRGWNTRWADSLIRLHTKWDAVKAAVDWSTKRGNPTDGVTGALKAVTEWKRRDETPEDTERRKRVKGARYDRKARDLVVARFLANILKGREIPMTPPVEIGEFIGETLAGEDNEPGGSEKRTSHSEDAEHGAFAEATEGAASDGSVRSLEAFMRDTAIEMLTPILGAEGAATAVVMARRS